MPHPIEYLFDVGSPTAYLAWHRLKTVAARTGASLVPVPILLGGVFKATGGMPPGAVAAKGRWMNEDMARWAARDGMPLVMNPFFPVNTITMMRILAGLQGDERFEAVTDTLFAGMWQQGRNMADPEILAATLTEAGHDAATLMELAQSPEAKQRLIANTEGAVARGVFGAPTCFVAGQMHFGQDRIDWVEAAAAG
ncbi:2-hydroxychromene-2-carboxylate isomerase [Sandarakinorhabdus oryzae]|uniref:2-hydroxychromene-2-carboxylate isomerase n=1 Tax=Sandarakinorhabdus oryzae TaxID=2675220 RepID=UPI0012E25AEC|nr:2-hydroxychromene-2-carboxylate isomerase [Sandarakinorhabdus oryzae]